MQLYEINNNGNRYCGPAVISAVAGIGTKEAAALIRAHTGRTAVKGTHWHELQNALHALGFAVSFPRRPLTPITADKNVNLRTWARTVATGEDVYLLHVGPKSGGHWVLAQGRHVICSKTRNFVAVDDHPNARSFVQEARIITKQRAVDAATVIPKPAPNPNAPTPSEATARRKAKALAAEHGIELERLNRERGWTPIGAWPPKAITEDEDEHAGDHYCDDWKEILHRVEGYVALLTTKNKTA